MSSRNGCGPSVGNVMVIKHRTGANRSHKHYSVDVVGDINIRLERTDDLYTADLLRLIECHGLHPHGYADDTQIYGFCSASSTHSLQERISACIDDVALWMSCNRLQLNTSKTEVLWCSTNRRQYQIPQCPVRVGEDLVTPSTAVRDL